MLQEGNYDVLEFSMPSQGMNQNISPDILPPSFAYALENIIAKPLGEGQVRFGTAQIMSLPNPEFTILKQFPFVKADGSEQILLYVQEYAQDATAHTFTVIDGLQASLLQASRRFSFTGPDNIARYVEDTAIKVEYTLNGHMTLYDTVASLVSEGNVVTVTLEQNTFPAEAVITHVSFSTGTLYSYDLSSRIPFNPLSAPLKQNLTVGCVPRHATFTDASGMGKLLICNGVDRVLSWDGTILEEVYDFVSEEVLALNRIDERHLSFVTSPSFEIGNYAVGNLLQIVVNGITTQTTIAACVLNAQTVTVTTTTDLPNFVQDQTQLSYQAWPPKFNFLFVAHDRLWALGEGAVGLAWRNPYEALRVYYASKTNTVTGWFNERTKTVPSLDLSKKHGEPDNLEAICLLGNFIAFMGRKKTQVYQGQNPLPLDEGGDFAFNAILPIGVIHGDLLVELPNDVFFINQSGLQSFSTLNVAKQFAVTSFDAVDPKIQQDVGSMMAFNASYRAACSFKYDGGSIAGFKIGKNKVLCSLFSTTLYSWSLFSGDFEKATSFLTLGNRLYLSLHNKVYKYADGNDGTPPCYADRGGKGSKVDSQSRVDSQLIPFSWTLPVIHLKGRRYANKRYELQLDYPSSFTVRPENQISIGISGDLPKSYQIDSPCRFELRGDLLQSIPLTETQAPQEDGLGFRFGQPFAYPKDRLKFMASKFWLTLSGYTKDGSLTFKKIKLYGIIER
jgi:hypothetical protein